MSQVPTLPTFKEIPRIGIYITVLTILVEAAKIIYGFTFDEDKEVIRNKLKHIFK